MPIQRGVDISILRLLQIGNDVIRRVKILLPYGAENQIRDRIRCEEAAARTSAAQQYYGMNMSSIKLMAGATVEAGAGNCQDQASVAYMLLRNSPVYPHSICFCISRTYGHVFCTIGYPAADTTEQVVVVDPWPIYCQAVILSDFFIPWSEIEVVRSKSISWKGGSKIRRAVNKINEANLLSLINANLNISFPAAHYDMVYCTRINDYISYFPHHIYYYVW